ncbi:alpha/beta hydrolase family protein [Gimesia chilikensis]|uniref:alpha/beta hydrolase family protein n=1 Tax=Gimesia chilikensis TaxID=2605989 RepID=UPI00118B4863|nr:alpha/beta fold hydrolase [Gimesia chilikensis]QDT83260.1 Alpha/beta hydrolase family protein [Gimesia chilikensis]
MNMNSVFFSLIFSLQLVGCEEQREPAKEQSQPVTEKQVETVQTGLEAARRSFTTKLTHRGPAPQGYEEVLPPAGVTEVEYTSGGLKLKAWLSDNPGDGKKHPAVVYLHGGWSFSAVDWQDVTQFIDAGFVVMMPMLRGENGNPGYYEAFYGEVDDALAAGRFVADLPYVNPDQVFIAGHSVGAVLTTLVAMMPSNFQAAAALSGVLDMELWSATGEPAQFVFNTQDHEEVRVRNPMAFIDSLQIPVILFAEPVGMDQFSRAFHKEAILAGKSCELKIVPGDHTTMVAPSVRQVIQWFQDQIENDVVKTP